MTRCSPGGTAAALECQPQEEYFPKKSTCGSPREPLGSPRPILSDESTKDDARRYEHAAARRVKSGASPAGSLSAA